MRFFKGLLGGHVRLGREHAHAAWSHPAHVQNLAHLRRLAGHPGEGFDPGRLKIAAVMRRLRPTLVLSPY
jgi:hypothetical protein